MSQTPAWFFNQSAVIPYRIKAGKIEVLLITSRKRKRWVIPKGVIEPSMSPQESATTEAWEEAGIIGQIAGPSIGVYKYQKWGGTCHVQVFLLKVETILEDWPEAIIRSRQWLSLEQAAGRVDEKTLKQMLLSLPDLLL